MYAVLPFALATGFVEVPYLILQAVIFVPVRSPLAVSRRLVVALAGSRPQKTLVFDESFLDE